jgi:hypothetical protein
MGFFSWLFGRKRKDKRDSWNRRALLVGINRYPDAPLAGCVNDVVTMKTLLTGSYGFSDGDIKVLTDGEATTDSMVDALNWLASAGPNTLAYLHFSGHGTQVPTGDHGEPDGLAEVICPVDFDWSPQHLIADDQLLGILSRMPPSTIFNWTSDSCHSGDLDRSVAPMTRFCCVTGNHYPLQPRTMPMPGALTLLIKRARAKREMKRRGMVDGKLDVGFASACRSDQTAADTFIDGKPCGAMTYYFAKALQALPRGASLEDIVSETKRNLARDGYAQVPQAEGARAKRAFLA